MVIRERELQTENEAALNDKKWIKQHGRKLKKIKVKKDDRVGSRNEMTKVDEHDFYFINRKKTLDQTLYFSQHSMAYQPLEWFEPWYKAIRELRSVDRD